MTRSEWLRRGATAGCITALVAAAVAVGLHGGSSAPATPGAPAPSASTAVKATSPTVTTPSGSRAWIAGLSRTMPPDLPGDLRGAWTEPSCAGPQAPGWLGAENRRPGARLPMDGSTFASGPVWAYTPRSSAGCGDVVPVSVSAPPGRYVVHAWRVGDYGGSGARVVWTSPPFAAAPQPTADGRDLVGQGPQWPVATTVRVAPDWPTGLYLLEVAGVSPTRWSGGWAPLVVHGPAVGAGRSSAVYVAATMTWAAYDPYGGASLYRSFSGPASTAEKRRARTVALARPSVLNGQRQVAEYTAPLVQAMERAGVDVDYVADTDVDALPSLLSGRAEVILGSHAEYATTRLYDALEAARNAGTNLAFLGGNQLYWHVRLTRSADGTPVTVVLYRELAEDPSRLTSPSDVTVRWRDPPLDRPEAALVGAEYSGLGVVAPWLVVSAPAWTGLTSGTVLAGAAAGEVDVATRDSPPQTQVIAQGTTKVGKEWVDDMVTYYVAPSGAAVLDTGSMDTGCLARDSCSGLHSPAATRQGVQQLVTAVVTGFATPRFGVTHPVDGSAGTWSTGAALARSRPAAVGRSLRGDDD